MTDQPSWSQASNDQDTQPEAHIPDMPPASTLRRLLEGPRLGKPAEARRRATEHERTAQPRPA